MFRSEKIVPKMSFASSCAERRVGRARAGPRLGSVTVVVEFWDCGTRVVVLEVVLDVEMGRPPEEERGRSGCRAQRRE
tara:strand:- start:221 stop:454 length:234 start_codon:yes stop_codon:yes gene_type:complete